MPGRDPSYDSYRVARCLVERSRHEHPLFCRQVGHRTVFGYRCYGVHVRSRIPRNGRRDPGVLLGPHLLLGDEFTYTYAHEYGARSRSEKE